MQLLDYEGMDKFLNELETSQPFLHSALLRFWASQKEGCKPTDATISAIKGCVYFVEAIKEGVERSARTLEEDVTEADAQIELTRLRGHLQICLEASKGALILYEGCYRKERYEKRVRGATEEASVNVPSLSEGGFELPEPYQTEPKNPEEGGPTS